MAAVQHIIDSFRSTHLHQSFQYAPLDPTQDQIRLLVVQPGELGNIVKAELVHASLNENPVYEAISYCWGGSRTVDIQLSCPNHMGKGTRPLESLSAQKHGSKFPITANLESALRHLRRPNKSRVLWADAICINQEDEVEKSHQVRLMDQIYKKCRGCLIWLGEAANDSDYAMDLIREMEYAIRGEPNQNVAMENLSNKIIRNQNYVRHCRALMHLISRPWFFRLWVVQEVILPPNCTVLCGANLCFLTPIMHMTMHLTQAIGPTGLSPDPQIQKQIPLPMFRNWNISSNLAIGWLASCQFMGHLLTLYISRANKNIITLKDLLYIFHGRNMTNKKDAVYGLLSLAGDVTPKTWNVDYTMSEFEVYKDAAITIIRNSEGLDIICQTISCSHDTVMRCSWVPIFALGAGSDDCSCKKYPYDSMTTSMTFLASSNPDQRRSPYRACGRTKAVISVDGNWLRTYGVRIGRVDVMKDPPRWSGEAYTVVPRDWFSSVLDSKNGKTVRDLDKFEELWRTMITDRVDMSNRPAPAAWGTALRLFLETNDGDIIVDWKNSDMAMKISPWACFKGQLSATGGFRRLFMTDEGRFGLGPKVMKKDDVVCILYGCSVPVILRSVLNAPGEHYRLIGESYIHGIGDGQIMEKVGVGNYARKFFTIV